MGKLVISVAIYMERREYRHLPQKYTILSAGRTAHSFRYRVVKP